jgi:predicted RNA-binding protein
MELADQWDRAMGKLDLQEDHIVVIEICMMMGTTLLNAIFHARGIREEAIDQNHTVRPDIPPEVVAKITPDVREIMDDLFYIEEKRKLHCRGMYPDVLERDLPEWDPPVVDQCVANIRKMQAFAKAALNE